MSTLVKLIISTILSLLMTSCINFGHGVDGDGNVVTKHRDLSTTFTTVKVSQGLDLHIRQANEVSLSVEADDNLHDLIMTEVENNVLNIYTTENIRRAKKRRVNLSVTTINAINASSGSDVVSKNAIVVDTLALNSSSGADIRLNVKTTLLNCNSSSGSDIHLTGITQSFIAEATSGSDIKATNLKTQTAEVKASSGADISVNTTKELVAKATSGADIIYYGNPNKVSKNDSDSGSIRKH